MVYSVIHGVNILNQKENEIKLNVGKTIVLKKDTLTIINYSMFNDSYSLSDGKEYNIDFIKTKIK